MQDMGETHQPEQQPATTLSIAKAASRLGIAQSTAYRLIAADDFPVPVLRIGQRRKVSTIAIEEFLRSADKAS